jgi:hypothetical protein
MAKNSSFETLWPFSYWVSSSFACTLSPDSVVVDGPCGDRPHEHDVVDAAGDAGRPVAI